MKIGIAGNGVVGGTLRYWLEKVTTHDVLIYDPRQKYLHNLNNVDALFIAVPVETNSLKQDLSIIEEILQKFKCKHTFIRSSVLPGTCDRLSEKYERNIHAMPEFLTERRAVDDFLTHPVHVGVPKVMGQRGLELTHNLLWNIFGDLKKFYVWYNKDCEIAKFSHNCFGAFKVTYFNMINHLCEEQDISYKRVLEIMGTTGFISDHHTKVPGPDGKYGYGGKCFPANMEAMTGYLGNSSFHLFFKDVMLLNNFFRNKQAGEDYGKYRQREKQVCKESVLHESEVCRGETARGEEDKLRQPNVP